MNTLILIILIHIMLTCAVGFAIIRIIKDIEQHNKTKIEYRKIINEGIQNTK